MVGAEAIRRRRDSLISLFVCHLLGQNENGPRGGAVPKGPLFHKPVNAGIPAPLFSRRETPINWARHYPAGGKSVKAIHPLNAGVQVSGVEGLISHARAQRG